uniref:Reverse transcriptase domain-containing protein n=1 Tax=Oncorhynchus kisutch TaxID=8019 RepID=A0A8C7DY33_ONCKI
MQSGFRAGHGCTSATLKILNDIITSIHKRKYCGAVFIDLAKAFDSVNHHILIGRFNSLGFSNDCLTWFTNYFSDRVQCVKSGDLFSGTLAVSMGVPQCSILGPTLFSVYINDVALAAGDYLIHIYADDTILYTSGPSMDTVLTNLHTSFNAIQLSFRGLQLLLNSSKTKCMLFNRSLPAPVRPSSITTLDGSYLEYVENQLPISQQIIIHSCCQTYPRKTDYPTDHGLWRCNSQNSLQHKLDAVYHSAIRFVTSMYALVGWPSLHIRRQTQWLQVINKSLLGKAPPYL